MNKELKDDLNINSSKLSKDWVVGFVDGEGCFYVGLNKMKTMTLGFQVLPEFRIVQHECDIQLLYSIKQFFGCGSVVQNKSKNDIIWEYRVRGLKNLSTKIIPFFEKNELKTIKRFSFLSFRSIVLLMVNGNHLTPEGLEKIINLKQKMNKRVKIESDLD